MSGCGLTAAERLPSGVLGLSWAGASAPFDKRSPDLSDCLVLRPKPWLLTVWEPLRTKAPSPARVQPWCCYIATVIFYARPYAARPWSKLLIDGRGRFTASRGGFEEYDKIETRLRHDDAVAFENETFIVNGGQVLWATHDGVPRWWMRRGARRRESARGCGKTADLFAAEVRL